MPAKINSYDSNACSVRMGTGIDCMVNLQFEVLKELKVTIPLCKPQLQFKAPATHMLKWKLTLYSSVHSSCTFNISFIQY